MVFAAAVGSPLTQFFFLLLQFYVAIDFFLLFYIRTMPIANSYVVFNYYYWLVHNSDLCRTDCA